MNSKETEALVDAVLDNEKELTAKTGTDDVQVELAVDATTVPDEPDRRDPSDETEYLNRSGRRYLFALIRKSKRGPNFTKPKRRR